VREFPFQIDAANGHIFCAFGDASQMMTARLKSASELEYDALFTDEKGGSVTRRFLLHKRAPADRWAEKAIGTSSATPIRSTTSGRNNPMQSSGEPWSKVVGHE
jgi:hypothetical protein